MSQPIYLAVYSNGAKPAHWSIWIPTKEDDSMGKVLHVTGNPATGFFLEFKRHYDIKTETRSYQTFVLAEVNDKYVADTPGTEESKDTTARDRLESEATVVTPPGRSANPFDPAAPNCQNWIFDFIERLIAVEVIADDCRAVLQSAPKKIQTWDGHLNRSYREFQ